MGEALRKDWFCVDEREKLEKMDLLRSRFQVTYAKAHEVLEATGWDVVAATLRLEAEAPKARPGLVEEIKVRGDDLVETLKKILHEGNVRRIIVKDPGGTEVLNLPVTGFVAFTVLLPLLTAFGAVVAVTLDYTVQVERRG